MRRIMPKSTSKRKRLSRGAFLYPAYHHSIVRGKNRITKIDKKLAEMETENARMKDQLLRQMAEFDNYRKRTEREFAGLVLNANESLIKEMLPIVDDLGRSLSSDNHAGDPKQFKEGIRMISDKFVKLLENQGVQPIKAVGEPFDAEKHEALLQMEKQDTPPDMVIEEYEKGYTMNEKVIRHSKVIVSR